MANKNQKTYGGDNSFTTGNVWIREAIMVPSPPQFVHKNRRDRRKAKALARKR